MIIEDRFYGPGKTLTMFLAVALLYICVCSSLSAQSGPSPVPRRSSSQHEIIINGQKTIYRTEAEETFLYGKDEKRPLASAITFSYIRGAEGQDEKRPVIFFFNGGPGASSSPLHLHTFGPIVISAGEKRALVTNENTLLDIADLVFIDPAGTGFTRIMEADSVKSLWDVQGDARAMLKVIGSWIGTNGRKSSPLYICGESYGTLRLAEMVGLNEEIKISGIILLSAVFDLTSSSDVQGNDIPYVLGFPTMAAISFYHHRSAVKAKNEADIFDKASAFAGSTYLTALTMGSRLTNDEKRKVASRMSQYIGLSADSLMAKDLRIGPYDFQVMLLAAQDKRIGILDGRKTGPLHTDLKPPFSDPSMSLGRDTAASRLMKYYFTTSLNFPDTGSYRSLNMKVNSIWNWSSAQKEFYFTVIPEFADAIKKSPELKIFMAGGIFDMATSLYSARYQMDHSGIDPKRVSFELFPTGHSIFEDKVQLKILADKIRLFILN